MIFKIYSILDTKAGAFAPPFFVANDQVAIRSVLAARNDPNGLMGRFPDDFKLFCLGDFDDEVGVLSPSAPKLIMENL